MLNVDARLVALSALGAAAATACLSCTAQQAGEAVGSNAQAIQGGDPAGHLFPAVGNFVPDPATTEGRCTATLVGEDIIVTAAHCVVRRQDCSPHLTSASVFVDKDGYSYPIDVENARAYVPAQSFAQLTDAAFSESESTGMCTGGARNELYYPVSGDNSGDIALLAVLPSPDTNELPGVEPMQLWTDPVDSVDSVLAGSCVWVGRTGGEVTLAATSVGVEHADSWGDLDLCEWRGELTQPIIAEPLACSPSQGTPGLTEKGDSGGPLVVVDQGFRIAGVASGAVQARVDGDCPYPGNQYQCVIGGYYQVWASVVDQADYLKQALRWAADDYDADNVHNDEDNCKTKPNPAQDNANLAFELSLLSVGAEALGDACDTAPVAQPVPGEVSFEIDADLWERCTGDADMSDCVVRLERHEIDLMTHFWSADATATETATTGFRYCICRDVDGELIRDKEVCKRDHGCLIDNDEFTKSEGLDPDLGETRWLRMRVSNDRFWPEEEGKYVTYKVGSKLVHQPRWHWEDDAPGWRAAGFWDDAVDPPPGFPQGPAIAGLMWAHNDSLAGIAEHFQAVPPICEAQPERCAFGNGYEFWEPFLPSYVCPRLPDIPDPIDWVASARATSTQAATEVAVQRYFPEPSLVLPVPLASAPDSRTFLPFDRTRFGSKVVDTGFAVPCETATGYLVAEMTLAHEAQVARIVDQAMTPNLRELLLQPSDLLWVGPSEPLELKGSGQNPLAIGVDTATGRVLKMIAPDGEGHLDALPFDIIPAATGAAAAAAALGPTTYSRLADTIVQLVGTSADDPLDTVRLGTRFAPSSAERELYPTGDRPLSVTAATFTWADQRLWLVGSVPAPKGGRHARDTYLFVIDVRTGHIEHRRQLLPSLSRFWLTTSDQSEAVLLAAVDDSPSYRIAVFQPGQPGGVSRAEPAGVRPASGRVIGPPRVGGGHVLVPVAKPASRVRPDEPRNYHVAAEPLDEVRGRLRGRLFHDQP